MRHRECAGEESCGSLRQEGEGDASRNVTWSYDIAEVVHTRLNQEATMLVVEWWTPPHGLRRIERE